jgi:hypothetical protein
VNHTISPPFGVGSDAVLVLVHAVVAGERDALRGQFPDHGADVGDGGPGTHARPDADVTDFHVHASDSCYIACTFGDQRLGNRVEDQWTTGGQVTELLRWQAGQGAVVVEVDNRDAGFESIKRLPGQVIHDVNQRLEDVLANIRDAAMPALKSFHDEALKPDEVEIEFGIKLNASAGAVIAKSSLEGHLVVKLKWTRNPDA